MNLFFLLHTIIYNFQPITSAYPSTSAETTLYTSEESKNNLTSIYLPLSVSKENKLICVQKHEDKAIHQDDIEKWKFKMKRLATDKPEEDNETLREKKISNFPQPTTSKQTEDYNYYHNMSDTYHDSDETNEDTTNTLSPYANPECPGHLGLYEEVKIADKDLHAKKEAFLSCFQEKEYYAQMPIIFCSVNEICFSIVKSETLISDEEGANPVLVNKECNSESDT